MDLRRGMGEMSIKTSISWADITINPITGCNNNCEYCYARKMANRLKGRFGYDKEHPFRPTFHPDKVWEIANLKGEGKRVFLDSMGDLFDPGVKKDWISAILDVVHRRPQHTFLALTKRPDNIPEGLRWPENLWIGVSVTCRNDVWRIDELMHNSPLPQESHLFVSFEPLHSSIEADLTGLEWVICGAETGNRKGKIEPELEWVKKIASSAHRLGIPVFIKNNLQELYKQQPGCLGGVQEFPKGWGRT